MAIVTKKQSASRTALMLGIAALLATASPGVVLAQPTKTGTRQPITNCPQAKAMPNNAAQIARLIQCAREGERAGTITILENIKVQFGTTRKYQAFSDGGHSGIDTAAPVLPLRGSLDRYVCNPITHKIAGDAYSVETEGKNCVIVHERKAEGSCVRTTFGDWSCSMLEAVHPDEWANDQPPPR